MGSENQQNSRELDLKAREIESRVERMTKKQIYRNRQIKCKCNISIRLAPFTFIENVAKSTFGICFDFFTSVFHVILEEFVYL